MSENLNQAVALLNDLLALSRVTTLVVDQDRLDALVDSAAVSALEEFDRFIVRLAADAEAAADAASEAEAAAARHAAEQEELAAQELVQDEEDQAQRKERHAAGVS